MKFKKWKYLIFGTKADKILFLFFDNVYFGKKFGTKMLNITKQYLKRTFKDSKTP